MKEFINGYDFSDKPSKKKLKPKFDKTLVKPDNEISCHNCSKATFQEVDKKKGSVYYCPLKQYLFFGYWRETQAKDCDLYKK